MALYEVLKDLVCGNNPVPCLRSCLGDGGSGEAEITACWTLACEAPRGCTRVYEDMFKGKQTKPANSAHGSGTTLLPKGVVQYSQLFILKLEQGWRGIVDL